jgi:hypothetical protein
MWHQVQALEDQIKTSDLDAIRSAATDLTRLLRKFPMLITIGSIDGNLNGPVAVSSKGEKIGLLSEFRFSVEKTASNIDIRARFSDVSGSELLSESVNKYKEILKKLGVDIGD